MKRASMALALLISACCKCPAQKPMPAPPSDSSVAAVACFKFRAFDCPEGDAPIAGGDTCEQVAGRVDLRIAFDAKCVADSNSIADVRRCPGVTCRAR